MEAWTGMALICPYCLSPNNRPITQVVALDVQASDPERHLMQRRKLDVRLAASGVLGGFRTGRGQDFRLARGQCLACRQAPKARNHHQRQQTHPCDVLHGHATSFL
jgi:hypothetical protein